MKTLIGWPSIIAIMLASVGCQESPSSNPSPVTTNRPAADTRSPASAGTELAFGRIIDLTHPFDEDTIYWPTAQRFQLEVVSAGVQDAGYFYAANRFAAAEHGGTHIDAPIHFSKDRQTVDEIPLGRLVGEGVVIDVTRQCEEDPNYQVQISDLRDWEVAHGRQLVDVILLLRTGFARHWPKAAEYLGTDKRGPEAVAMLRFPGLHPDAAGWLAEQRAVKAVGIDTASIDYGQSRRFGSHVKLFEHNIPVFENVAHLDQLPIEGFTVVALPMKIRGGSGGPLRIAALLPTEE